ncbi:DUF3084 domain-containing protein [bacterium]|nr:DUF3084 domain-containing protein [bacterium]
MLLAAGIAYLGNQLGRSIGKRKMSICRLRPRHTSMIITSCTGAFIAVATLTIFACVSEPVRELLGGLENLRREEADLHRRIDALTQTLSEGVFVWTMGEPIVHMTLPDGLPIDRTRSALTGLLAEANTRTVLRNNKIAKEKKEPLLKVTDLLIDSEDSDYDKVAEKLTAGNGVSGLRVVAKFNCLYRQKAQVKLESWPVKLVFKKGDEVLRKEMSVSGMVTDFYQFIEEMKAAAIKKGIIPIDGSVGGGISEEEFNELQDKMNAQKSKFYLVAKANRDLYETNSLDVTISVVPGPKPAEPAQESYQW